MVTKAFSIEDGKQGSSILTSRKASYSDIDLQFATKLNGDIFKKLDAAAVKQSIKNIVRCRRLEKPFNSDFGSNIGTILFELADAGIAEEAEGLIISAIARWEPRAINVQVIVDPRMDQNEIAITIKFQVGNTVETETIETTIARLR